MNSGLLGFNAPNPRTAAGASRGTAKDFMDKLSLCYCPQCGSPKYSEDALCRGCATAVPGCRCGQRHPLAGFGIIRFCGHCQQRIARKAKTGGDADNG